MDNTVAPIVGGALLAVLLLLTALRALRRRTRRSAQPDPESVDLSTAPSPSGGHVAADQDLADGEDLTAEDEVPAHEHVMVDAAAGTAAEPPLVVRSLRAQVRTLEEALQQLQDEEALEGTVSDESAFRRQVGAALRGLGDRNRGDESPERMLARVAAAIERLEAPAGMTRPALPAVAFSLAGQQVTLSPPSSQEPFIRPEALAIASAAAPAPATPPPSGVGPADPDHTLASPAALSAETPGQSDDAPCLPGPGEHVPEEWLSAPPEPEVVLPVPPRSPALDHGHRRWGRRASTSSKAMR